MSALLPWPASCCSHCLHPLAPLCWLCPALLALLPWPPARLLRVRVQLQLHASVVKLVGHDHWPESAAVVGTQGRQVELMLGLSRCWEAGCQGGCYGRHWDGHLGSGGSEGSTRMCQGEWRASWLDESTCGSAAMALVTILEDSTLMAHQLTNGNVAVPLMWKVV